MRVNSPGGDVYASSMITNALEEFQSTGRPVITSMGDIAASGGVWVTTTSEEIWAEENHANRLNRCLQYCSRLFSIRKMGWNEL